MSGTFSFCPTSQVVELIPPESVSGISLNGWNFSAKPTVPYQAKWKVMLYGLRWYLQSNGTFDSTTDPTHNARALEIFYQNNQTWDSFTWSHPHIGSLTVRFAAPVVIPAAEPNSGGLIAPVEINLIHHNPGY